MTYTELRQAIIDYTQNQEITFLNQISTFIKQAEERINRSVSVPDLRKNVTGTISQSNRFLNTPSDFLAVFSMAVVDGSNDYQFLLHKDVSFMREAYSSLSTSGVPKYYGLFDDTTFIIAPLPSAEYSVQLHYYYDPVSITESSQTITVASSSGTFTAGETITGSVSGNTAIVKTFPNATTLTVGAIFSSFTLDETLTGSSSGATAVFKSITSDTTESWFSKNATTVLLYGSLIESYTFMKGEADIMNLYQKRYDEALKQLFDLGIGKNRMDSYRNGESRVQAIL